MEFCGLAVIGERVAHPCVGDLLDAGGDEADLARPQLIDQERLRREHAHPVELVGSTGAHEADLLALAQGAVADPEQRHDTEIAVVPAVDDERLERRLGVALGRRQTLDDRLQHLVDADPGLGRDHQRVRGVEADNVLDLLPDAVGLGCRQVDLVQDGDDLEVGVDRLVGIGERLRLHALRGVDQQQGAFAGAHGAADLVGEVDMARRVDEVEDEVLAVAGAVAKPDGLRLDRDAALALDVHRIEHLRGHLARFQATAAFDQPVGQCRLAVVDMRHDGEVADAGEVGHVISCQGAQRSPMCGAASLAPNLAERSPAVLMRRLGPPRFRPA